MTPASGFFQTFLTDAVFGTAYFWLPIILGYIAWKFWIYCIRYKFIANAPWVTLEIKIPRDVFKSPQAMEVVLNGISVAKDGNFLERYGGGFLRSWYSLEIASFEGNVHFYIRVIRPLVRLATAQFYGQYPDIEITEVDDYVTRVPDTFPNIEFDIWGAVFKTFWDVCQTAGLLFLKKFKKEGQNKI